MGRDTAILNSTEEDEAFSREVPAFAASGGDAKASPEALPNVKAVSAEGRKHTGSGRLLGLRYPSSPEVEENCPSGVIARS
jgi:hypothetical protein